MRESLADKWISADDEVPLSDAWSESERSKDATEMEEEGTTSFETRDESWVPCRNEVVERSTYPREPQGDCGDSREERYTREGARSAGNQQGEVMERVRAKGREEAEEQSSP